jgi:hypothetical protein
MPVQLLAFRVKAAVLRKYDIRKSSYRDLLQFVSMVKPTKYENCRNAMVFRNVMQSWRSDSNNISIVCRGLSFFGNSTDAVCHCGLIGLM